MNQHTIDALCVMLSTSKEDLLKNQCFRKMIYCSQGPLRIFTGLDLGQHYVNSFIESLGKSFRSCTPIYHTFEEFSKVVENCSIFGPQIAIDMFSEHPFIVQRKAPSIFDVTWSANGNNQVGTQLNAQNYETRLPKPFDAFLIRQENSANPPSLDQQLSLVFEKEYLNSLFLLSLGSNESKRDALENLNSFVQSATLIGTVNNDQTLLDYASKMSNVLNYETLVAPLGATFRIFHEELKELIDAIIK